MNPFPVAVITIAPHLTPLPPGISSGVSSLARADKFPTNHFPFFTLFCTIKPDLDIFCEEAVRAVMSGGRAPSVQVATLSTCPWKSRERGWLVLYPSDGQEGRDEGEEEGEEKESGHGGWSGRLGRAVLYTWGETHLEKVSKFPEVIGAAFCYKFNNLKERGRRRKNIIVACIFLRFSKTAETHIRNVRGFHRREVIWKLTPLIKHGAD